MAPPRCFLRTPTLSIFGPLCCAFGYPHPRTHTSWPWAMETHPFFLIPALSKKLLLFGVFGNCKSPRSPLSKYGGIRVKKKLEVLWCNTAIVNPPTKTCYGGFLPICLYILKNTLTWAVPLSYLFVRVFNPVSPPLTYMMPRVLKYAHALNGRKKERPLPAISFAWKRNMELKTGSQPCGMKMVPLFLIFLISATHGCPFIRLFLLLAKLPLVFPLTKSVVARVTSHSRKSKLLCLGWPEANLPDPTASQQNFKSLFGMS